LTLFIGVNGLGISQGFQFIGFNMKTTVYFSEFCDYFQKIRPDNFSYQGLRVLFDYLEEIDNSCGEDSELDVIGLCCDFAESDWQTIAADYDSSIELDKTKNVDEQKAQVLDFLADQGALVGETDHSIVYRQF
jgi:hypothetical protein